MEQTQFEATTLEGFIQQIAVSFVGKGYFYYATGRVPEGMDPLAIDRKLAKRYRADISKWSRYRRKRAGLANVRYLRYESFFILVATPGKHRFFKDEASLIRDCRRVPIKFGGYAISSRNGRAHVRIEQEQYNLLKAYTIDLALRRRAGALERMLASLPFEPYAPVRRQVFNLIRAMNKARKVAGFEPVSPACIRMKRRIVGPFDPVRPGHLAVESTELLGPSSLGPARGRGSRGSRSRPGQGLDAPRGRDRPTLPDEDGTLTAPTPTPVPVPALLRSRNPG